MQMTDATGWNHKPLANVSSKPAFGAGHLLAPIFALVMTIWIDPSYTGGDPSLYRYVYDSLGNETLSHGFFFYSVILSSTEPLYYFVVWILTHLGVPREVFIGLTSGLLAFLVVNILVRRGAHIIVATIIASSSFYFLLLYTTTERLKLAVILLIISVLTLDRIKISIFFAILATAAHIQVAILYASFLAIFILQKLYADFREASISPRVIGTIAMAAIILAGAYALIGGQVSSKAGSYVGLGQMQDLLFVMPFYVATMFYTKQRFIVTILFVPIILLSPIIGYGRLNMFSYFILLYYSVEKRGGLNVAVVITSLYFAYSSFLFVNRILEFGDPLLVGQ